MAIDTVANYKSYRGITVPTWDTQLGVLLTNGQAQMERFCDRAFDSATVTEYYDGGAELVLLRRLPVASITSITITTPLGDSRVLTTDEYTANNDTGEVRLYQPILGFDFSEWGGLQRQRYGIYPRFPKGRQNITVVYTGGYTSQTMPADLKQALYEIMDELFVPVQNGQGDDKRLQSENIGGKSYTRRSMAELVALQRFRLGPFRRMIL